MMVRDGVWLVPTLVAPRGVLDAIDRGDQVPELVAEKARMVVDAHRDSFARAVDAGVPIAMGTDTGVTPHGQNLRELGLMVAGGMSPTAVLQATTLSAARLMRLDDDLGTVEPGKLADLVVVDGDPLQLDGLKAGIRQVWREGRRYL